jgi:hypothetical protein
MHERSLVFGWLRALPDEPRTVTADRFEATCKNGKTRPFGAQCAQAIELTVDERCICSTPEFGP